MIERNVCTSIRRHDISYSSPGSQALDSIGLIFEEFKQRFASYLDIGNRVDQVYICTIFGMLTKEMFRQLEDQLDILRSSLGIDRRMAPEPNLKYGGISEPHQLPKSPIKNAARVPVTLDEGGGMTSMLKLSSREFQVGRLVRSGLTNQQIARRLGISHKTVETYLSRMFKKLDVSSRAEIAGIFGLHELT